MTSSTASGRTLAVVAVAAAVAGWRLGWTEMWALAAGCTAALVSARLASAAVPQVRARRDRVTHRVTVGTPVEVALTLRNPGRRTARSRPAFEAFGPGRVRIDLPSVPAGGEVELAYSVPTARRGHLTLGPLLVDRSDSLGLFAAMGPVAGTADVVVHPARHPLRIDPAGQRRDLDGSHVDRVEGSINFHALREYVPGDDLRRVHWRSSARSGTLVVRHDVDPSEPRACAVVDLASQAWADDAAFEGGIEVIASLVAAAARAGMPLHLADGRGTLSPVGEGGVVGLDLLAGLDREDGWGLEDALRDAVTLRAGLAVVVTGERSRLPAGMIAARAAADRAVVVVVAPGEPTSVDRDAAGGLVVVAPTAGAAVGAWDRAGSWRG